MLTLSLILILIFVGADGHDHLTVSEEDALLRGGKQPQIEEDGTGREHSHGLQIEEDGTGQAQAWERVLWLCSGSSSPSVTLTTTATSSTTPTSFLGLRLCSTGTIKSRYEWIEAGRMGKETSRRKRDSWGFARLMDSL